MEGVQLTSGLFLGLMSVLSLLCFGGTVWLTGRLHGRVRWAVARGAAIALTCLTLTTTLGVKLNADNGWYTSWSDLTGQGSASDTSRVGSGDFRPSAGGGAPATGPLPGLPSPGARVQTYRWHGPSSGITATVSVILPAGYRQNAKRTYPVIEAFHGIPGSPAGWLQNLGLRQAVDRAVARKTLAAPAVVIPQLDPSGRDTECTDSAKARTEKWLTRDVPALVRSHLRVATRPDHWATMGYSAGGWCANAAAMLHPGVYGAAISLGGYFHPDFSGDVPAGWRLADSRRYDLARVARTRSPRVALWIQAGQQSEYWAQTQAFLRAVKPPTSATSVVLASSGHRFDVWEAGLPDAFAWLGRTLPGFAGR